LPAHHHFFKQIARLTHDWGMIAQFCALPHIIVFSSKSRGLRMIGA
jgi:hypothetical protein